MRNWLMTWNSETFDLDTLRREGRPVNDWRVGRFRDELSAGDRFLLWRSGGGGIAALGRIEGKPEFKAAPSPDEWTDPPEPAWFVPLVIDSWHDRRVAFKTLRADARFEGMKFIGMPGAPNPHPVTEAQWAALMTYL
ncbi:EVE domain-containing protein [Nonomuraea sp. NPDC050540]|uniref:EVE domain-containing protein n=1 Tax=Nonomuraea sp. NPDC050540 TaxID=3364367 RepID=UPI0037B1A5AB